VPSYQLTIEIPSHGDVQVDISRGIFGPFFFNVLHVGILANKDLGPYGYLAMNALSQPCLMDILDIVFPIRDLGCEYWVDYGNSLKDFFPFFFVIISFRFLCLHFYCVDKKSFCMSLGRTLVLSSSPKLQEYL
jgi:hypothetical protein